jgi:hypothetical protein
MEQKKRVNFGQSANKINKVEPSEKQLISRKRWYTFLKLRMVSMYLHRTIRQGLLSEEEEKTLKNFSDELTLLINKYVDTNNKEFGLGRNKK